MIKTNFSVSALSVLAFSILFSISGCKKETSPPQEPERIAPAAALTSVTATYPVKYFDTVNKLIRQGKNYTSFQSLPGWQIINTETKSIKSNELFRTADDSEAFTSYDQDDYSPRYINEYLYPNGNDIEEWPYSPGTQPQAEQTLYSDQVVVSQGSGFEADGIMSWSWYYVPKPKLMVLYKHATFTKRDVSLRIMFQFVYVRIDASGSTKYYYSPINYPFNYFVTGTKMGEIDESNPSLYSNLTRDGYGEFSGAGISEKRTIIYSVQGSMKVSANVNLGAFQVGGELGAGFTITSASHTYTHYSVSGTVVLEQENYVTTPSYQMNFSPQSFGVQKE
jgi:hypothetical protein